MNCVHTCSKRHRTRMKMGSGWMTLKDNVKYLDVVMDKRLICNKLVKKTLNKLQRAFISLDPIICWRSNVSVDGNHLLIRTCVLPVMEYGCVQPCSRIFKSNVKQLEVIYEDIIKRGENFPRPILDEMLFQMLDEDPIHLRLADSQRNLLLKLYKENIE